MPNTSTFVPNDRSQCLYCVLPIMRCAFGAHIDEPRADSLEISRFLPSFLGKMAVFDKTEPLVMMPCEALSLLPSRLSCLTRRSCLYRMQMENVTRQSCAALRDTLSLLPSRRRCQTRRNCVNCMPMERMVRRSCPTRQNCPTRMGSVMRPAYNRSGEV